MGRTGTIGKGAVALLAGALASASAAQSAVVETVLVAPDGEVDDRFGESVACDGGTALVSAPRHEHAAGSPGSVYVFERAGPDLWVLRQELLPDDPEAAAGFGRSVAVREDVAVVGADFALDAAGAPTGAAYVFERRGRTWLQAARLVAPDGQADDVFGVSVALSRDRIVVGAPADDDVANGAGSAWVFRRAPGGWAAEQKLVGSTTGFFSLFGGSVSISGDRVAVGAVGFTVGEVFVFERRGGTWNEVARPAPPTPVAGTNFGESVALDGDVLAATASGYGDPGPNAGAVWVFRRGESGWAYEARLQPFDAHPQQVFGSAVAVLGPRVAVGASWEGAAGEQAGAVYVFRDVAGAWCDTFRLLAGTPDPMARLGSSVAVSGNVVLGGAPSFTGQGLAGEVGVYRLPASSSKPYCTAKTASNGCLPRTTAEGVASVSGGGCFLLMALDVPSSVTGLVFYGLDGPAARPFAGGTLCVRPPLVRTPLASSGGSPVPRVDCTGVLALDLNAWIAAGRDPAIGAGRTLHAQVWFRDPPHPDGTGVGLSDGAAVTVGP